MSTETDANRQDSQLEAFVTLRHLQGVARRSAMLYEN